MTRRASSSRPRVPARATNRPSWQRGRLSGGLACARLRGGLTELPGPLWRWRPHRGPLGTSAGARKEPWMSKSDTKAWVALIRTEHNRMIPRFSFMRPVH